MKHSIQALLEEKKFICFEEAYCIDVGGSNRFIDILAFDPDEDLAYLIDPTVRFESNRNVAKEVAIDKAKYENVIPDLHKKYAHMEPREYKVVPLWFGARGSICSEVEDFFTAFELDKKKMLQIAERVHTDSLSMLHYHMYPPGSSG